MHTDNNSIPSYIGSWLMQHLDEEAMPNGEWDEAYDFLNQIDEAILENMPNPDTITATAIPSAWAELLPLIHTDSDVNRAHTLCMRIWLSLFEIHEAPWAWTRNRGIEPWRTTTSDIWATRLDEMFEAAVARGNEEAVRIGKMLNALYVDKTSHDVNQEEYELRRDDFYNAHRNFLTMFEPTAREPGYWIPYHASRYFIPFLYILARTWRPEGDWRILAGPRHAVVIDLKLNEVFDLLLHDHMTGPEIVRLASN